MEWSTPVTRKFHFVFPDMSQYTSICSSRVRFLHPFASQKLGQTGKGRLRDTNAAYCCASKRFYKHLNDGAFLGRNQNPVLLAACGALSGRCLHRCAETAMLDRLYHGHMLKCGPRSWRTKTSSPGEGQ
jgi:hypothetical protein